MFFKNKLRAMFCVLVFMALSASVAYAGVQGARQNLNQILTAMRGNPFVVNDEKTGSDTANLRIGTEKEIFFASKKVPGKQIHMCFIMKVNVKTRQSQTFLDAHCKGVPYKKVGQDKKWGNVSESDDARYAEILREFAPFISAMQQYRKYSTSSTRFQAERANRENAQVRLPRVLKLLRQTNVTTSSEHQDRIVFSSSDAGLLLGFSVDHDESHYVCTVGTRDGEDEEAFIDGGCDGTLDYRAKKGGEFRKIDPIANAVMYQRMLDNLTNFLQASVEVFPRR